MDVGRAYTQAIAGLTEVARQRAQEAAGQLSGVAGGAAATARTGRHVLLEVLRGEVARSATGLGLASPAEVDRLRRRVEALERRLRQVDGEESDEQGPSPADMPAVARPPAAAARTASTGAAGRKLAATKSTASKGAARKGAAKAATATEVTGRAGA